MPILCIDLDGMEAAAPAIAEPAEVLAEPAPSTSNSRPGSTTVASTTTYSPPGCVPVTVAPYGVQNPERSQTYVNPNFRPPGSANYRLEMGPPGFSNSGAVQRPGQAPALVPPYNPGQSPTQTGTPKDGPIFVHINGLDLIEEIELNREIERARQNRANTYIASKQSSLKQGPKKYEVYKLIAKTEGWYEIAGKESSYTQQYYGVPNANVRVNTMTGATEIYVEKGTLLKIGQTADPKGRYTKLELENMRVKKVELVENVTESMAKVMEKTLIVLYPKSQSCKSVKVQTGLILQRPALNKIDK
jgi:hypothetical protein